MSPRKVKSKGGRPRVPRADKKSEGVFVSVTKTQRAWLEDQATTRSMSAVVCELIDAAREGRAPLVLRREGM